MDASRHLTSRCQDVITVRRSRAKRNHPPIMKSPSVPIWPSVFARLRQSMPRPGAWHGAGRRGPGQASTHHYRRLVSTLSARPRQPAVPRARAEHAVGKQHEVFGSIISFEVRLAICSRFMAPSSLEEVEQRIWRKMSARLSKFYKKRHEIAHFAIGRLQTAKAPSILF